MSHNIDIYEFTEKFEQEYEFCYQYDDEITGFEEAVIEFDSFSDKNPEFVREFENFREDIILSDRERAAFMFALEDLTQD